MERLASVWAELQKNTLPSSSLMSSCHTEIQDLMYQLDVMLSAEKQQWMQETEELQARLQTKEQELRTQQTALEMKTREMEDTKNQMEGLNKAQKSIVDEYEDHLSKLRAEVLKVRKEYEKLHRQHQRYKKDLQRKKEQDEDARKEIQEEIQRLREKLKELEGRDKDWEHQVRGQQHEIDMLEAQKRTLMEKCEFLQQQAQIYQSQVGRRREMQDSSEDRLKSHISQLETKVDRSMETIVSQKEKIEKLKASLDEAMSNHKQTMGDNEKLLIDLQKANETIQMLEERIAELEGEIRSKEEQLQEAQDDTRQYCQDVSRLEITLNAKDNIIKHMTDSHDFEESEQVRRLKEALQNARDDLKSQKQKSRQLSQATSSTITTTTTQPSFSGTSTTSAAATAAATTTPKLTTAADESQSSSAFASSSSEVSREVGKGDGLHRSRKGESEQNPDVQQLQREVKKLQEKLAAVNSTHSVELTAMRQTLAEMSSELHHRNTQLASLSERSSEMEKSMREESDVLDKKVAELKVAQTQMEGLRTENRQLRRQVLSMEKQHSSRTVSPDTQNHVMRREMNVLRNSVEDVIIRSTHNSARTDTSHNSVFSDRHSGSLATADTGVERFSAMDDYLESSIRRYDDQLQMLERQKAKLQNQMSQGPRHASGGHAPEEGKAQEGGSSGSQWSTQQQCSEEGFKPDDTQGSEPMSLISERHSPSHPHPHHSYPKVERLRLPHSSDEDDDDELTDTADEATQAFVQKESQHTTELERRLNAQINHFTHGMHN